MTAWQVRLPTRLFRLVGKTRVPYLPGCLVSFIAWVGISPELAYRLVLESRGVQVPPYNIERRENDDRSADDGRGRGGP